MHSTDKAVAFCVVAELQHPEMNYGPGVSGELRGHPWLCDLAIHGARIFLGKNIGFSH